MSGILVVDDHPVIAKACGLVLEPIGIEKIISAHDVDTGYQAFVEHDPDVSVIDLSLRGEELDGIALIKRIRSRNASAKILVFSMRSDRSSFVAAIEAGATGYLIKDSPTDEFAKAVQTDPIGPALYRPAACPQPGVSQERRALSQGTADTRPAAGGCARSSLRRRMSRGTTLTYASVYSAPVGTIASMVTPLSPEATVSVPPSAKQPLPHSGQAETELVIRLQPAAVVANPHQRVVARVPRSRRPLGGRDADIDSVAAA